MRKLLKDAKITSTYGGVTRTDYHTRLENITILQITDKSWLIKFPVKGDIIQMWFPKKICVLWKEHNILSVPQWYYKRTYPREELVWQESYICKERT